MLQVKTEQFSYFVQVFFLGNYHNVWRLHECDAFHITGPLWGETSVNRWFPQQKASNAGFYLSLLLSRTINKKDSRVIGSLDGMILMRRHCNDVYFH